MINKLIIDGVNTELDENSPVPYTYTFSQAKTHTVKIALDDTDEICAEAFKDCPNLTKITIPEEITMIKRRAFENCTGLTNLTIPDSVKYIGAHVFDGCKNLKELHFEATTPPAVYCDVPSNTTCFVPNDSKYLEFDVTTNVIDTTGETKYYTRNFYHAYDEILNPNNVDTSGAVTYYVDGWVSLCDNSVSKEEKDRIPIEDIQLAYTSLRLAVSNDPANKTTFKLTYELLPEDETNHNIYWKPSSNNLVSVVDESQPNEVYLQFENISSTGGTSLTAYAESGAYKTIVFNLYNADEQTTEAPEETTTEAPKETTTPAPTFANIATVLYNEDGTVNDEVHTIDVFTASNGGYATDANDHVSWNTYEGFSMRADKSGSQQTASGDEAIKISDYLNSVLTAATDIKKYGWAGSDEDGELTIFKTENSGTWRQLVTPANVEFSYFVIAGIPNKNKSDSINSMIAFDPENTEAYSIDSTTGKLTAVKYVDIDVYDEDALEDGVKETRHVQACTFVNNKCNYYRINIKNPRQAVYMMCGNGSDKAYTDSIGKGWPTAMKCVYLHIEINGKTYPVVQKELDPVSSFDVNVTEFSSLCKNPAGEGFVGLSDKGKIFSITPTGESTLLCETEFDTEGITVDGDGNIFVSTEKNGTSTNNVLKLTAADNYATYTIANSAHTSLFSDLNWVALTGSDDKENNGFEGIAWILDDEFVLGLQDKPASIIRYSLSKGIISNTPIFYSSEIADLDYDATTQHLFTLDSTTGLVYETTLDAEVINIYKLNFGSNADLETLNPEALYVDADNKKFYVGLDTANTKMYVFQYGETPTEAPTASPDSGSSDTGSEDTGSEDTGSSDTTSKDAGSKDA